MLDVPDLRQARDRMVERQIAGRGIADRRVVAAMAEVPREAFVEEGTEEFAYQDSALPIRESQTISQPYIVALMIEAAAVTPDDVVLEVGAGSGYAAAVLGRIARRVIAIERHRPLAIVARERLVRLGYDNVEIRVGDGTKGLPEEAPFDAIVVSAGGPEVPQALREQLAVGGRLVMPVGLERGGQLLTKLTRHGETEFEVEDLGAVNFVPLIGEHGWAEEGGRRRSRQPDVPRMIAEAADPLPDIDDPAFGRLFDRFADRRVVLLGEASHGTSEFYRARAAITRRLVEAHGFTVVAVEADWPDAAAIDRHVQHRPAAARSEPPFQRFPTWMWRNVEVEAFVHWLRSHNEGQSPAQRAGFYGLDIYNLNGSIGAVLDYLDRVDPAAAAIARQRYGCLTPWQKDPATYGQLALTAGYRSCESDVVAQCRDMLQRRLASDIHDGASLFDATQNARLIATAERYYRSMYYGGAESWNLRDTAMFDTLKHVIEARGRDTKAVVWAHNSHIGDARHTEMGNVREELNVGQLCREHFGGEAALIGFGTHTGTVAAASDWDGDMEIKQVRPSHPESYEALFHGSGVQRLMLQLDRDDELCRRLARSRLERFIGVIYRPESELMSHYAEAVLPRQFDAYVWFDETSAVTPLGPQHAREGVPDTYPFGL